MTTTIALSNSVTSDNNHSDKKMRNHQEETKHESCNGFVIREIPVHRLFNAGHRGANNGSFGGSNRRGKSFSLSGMNNAIMDYDVPEFVVFIQEDPHQFVKEICNCFDELVSSQGKDNVVCFIHPNLQIMGKISSTIDSEGFHHHDIMDEMRDYYEMDGIMKNCDCKNLIMNGEVQVDSGDKVSTDHTTMRTSQTLREAFKRDAEFSSSFKNWQMNEPITAMMSRPNENGKSQCMIIGSSETQADELEEISSSYKGPAELCNSRSHHQYNDSTSSNHSFAFPILAVEWNGTPVRMMESDKSKSRKSPWWKKRFSCWKCC